MHGTTHSFDRERTAAFMVYRSGGSGVCASWYGVLEVMGCMEREKTIAIGLEKER